MGGLMAFDLDGTLTQHKTPLEQENRCVLDELRGRGWSLLMVGRGSAPGFLSRWGAIRLTSSAITGCSTAGMTRPRDV